MYLNKTSNTKNYESILFNTKIDWWWFNWFYVYMIEKHELKQFISYPELLDLNPFIDKNIFTIKTINNGHLFSYVRVSDAASGTRLNDEIYVDSVLIIIRIFYVTQNYQKKNYYCLKSIYFFLKHYFSLFQIYSVDDSPIQDFSMLIEKINYFHNILHIRNIK